MADHSQHFVSVNAPTRLQAPLNLEARQVLERAQAELFGEPGPSVGRYEILRKLGSGGMGVVYEAYDPVLDCQVAIKQLRPELAAEQGFLERLRREAQAMAKLRTEPRVVTLYDFFVQNDLVFVVMEYVDGTTLRAWQAEPRAWTEILDTYFDAGRGLAAAHRAGLVHRDFKPDNVMIGRDDRVRVMDFGLARADRTTSCAAEDPGSGALESEVTRAMSTRDATEAIIGTPGYMAPEQWEGAVVDARADQFAFCVALWEALFEQRPFAGDTWEALAEAVSRGRIGAPPAGSRVPQWLVRVLYRGLSETREARWPTMDALLEALASGHRRRRRKRALIVGVGLTAIALGVAGVERYRRARTIAGCEAAGGEIAAIWSEARRDELRGAFADTGLPHAATTFDMFAPWVDRWTREWSQTRTQECLAAEVESTRTPLLAARIGACLDERRDELAALLEVLADADRTAIQRAIPAAAGLPSIASCVDPVALARRASTVDDGARAGELRRDLVRARSLRAAGKFADGLSAARTVRTAAEALGFRALAAEARLVAGELAHGAGEYDEAEETLSRAYADAGALGADDVAAAACVGLVKLVGVSRARPVEGLIWARSAEMFVQRLDEGEGLLGADLLAGVAAIHRRGGAYDEAFELNERALAIRRRALGPTHPDVAASLNNLGIVNELRGARSGTQAYFEEALAIREATLGPAHPDVASSLNNLAGYHDAHGEHREAQALYERALAISEAALGPEHLDVAMVLENLAIVHELRGDFARSLECHARALAIVERALPADHPRVAAALHNLAHVHYELDQLDDAEAHSERALAIYERAAEPDPAGLVPVLDLLAEIRSQRGDYDEAQRLLERVLAVEQRSLPADHRDHAKTRVALGELALARGRFADAVPLLEQASTLLDASEAPLRARVSCHFALARALWDAPARAGRDRARARSLVQQAVVECRGDVEGCGDRSADLEAWLAARGADERGERRSADQ